VVGFGSGIRIFLRGGLFNTGRERAWKIAARSPQSLQRGGLVVFFVMDSPFESYNDEVEHFLAKPRTTTNATEQQL